MAESKSDCSESEAPRGRYPWVQRGIIAGVCALVMGVYAYTAHSAFLASSGLNPADNYYNLLVQGFRAGQLNLKTEVPPGLAQLADPYDPSAHSHYPVLDMSYYKGKLYLYFGVTPALVLFWPYVALTGHYLLQKDAAVIFCVAGFLVSGGLLCALWRRYFAEVSVAVVAASMVALGLATFTPMLLARCDVYEVSISCAYALTMLALAAVWKALHDESRRDRWLAAASVAYGLALGARPTLLFGATVLLVPVAQAWRDQRKVWAPLCAATGPIMLIGLGLMVYNALRFSNPFEFGMRYQLSPDRMDTGPASFSLHYFWYHFRVYFMEPARWTSQFPFVHEISLPPWPTQHQGIVDRSFGIVTSVPADMPFGVLTNIPLVWLALAAPLAWRSRPAEGRSRLRRFLGTVGLFTGVCVLTICLFRGGNMRYEVDFLPTMVLLAVVGILGLERAFATESSGPKLLVGRPAWRRVVRWGWRLLLGFSVAFNLLASVERCAEAHNNQGMALHGAGRIQEALGHYEQALRLKPDYAEPHYNLGVALQEAGQMQEAIGHYEQALRLKPDYAEAHNNLGVALQKAGQMQEAIGHYEQALRFKPDYADAHYNLGIALSQAGRVQEAIRHYEQALGAETDSSEAHNNLGVALMDQGRLQEAIAQYEQALQIRPDNAEAHYNLGIASVRLGNMQEAIGHFEWALRIKPDYAEAQINLARARAGQ